MNYSIFYTSTSNPWAIVKLNTEGEFVAIDCDPTDAELAAMLNEEVVAGYELEVMGTF